MTKKIIFQNCLEILKKYPPINKIISEEEIYKTNSQNHINIKISTWNDIVNFIVEVKGILKRPLPLHLYFQNISNKVHPLIMAKYINSSIAKDLINNNINFVDCYNNIYLNILNKIYIKDIGNNKSKPREKKTTTIYNTKGMQLLSLLLNDENLINNTLRDLKTRAGISLERAYRAMKELKDKGYAIKQNENNYLFDNKKELFKNWISYYKENMRCNLLIGTYRISNKLQIKNITQNLNKEEIKFAYGGETGGELLTNYYRAGCKDIYIQEENSQKARKNLNLIKAKDYNLRLFNLYSKNIIYKYVNGNPVVLPLLIYAELLSLDNKRANKTAKIIYENYIKDKIE